MANHITNDRGETVLAIGAPGSQARLECERPGLIAELADWVADRRTECLDMSADADWFWEDTLKAMLQDTHDMTGIELDSMMAILV